MPRWVTQPSGRICLGLTMGVIALGAVGYVAFRDRVGIDALTGLFVVLYSAVAAYATLAAWARQGRSAGLQRRVWRLFALGLTCWTLSGVPYLVFLTQGGQTSDPAAWTQVGYLLAYPFWYGALWLLRRPVLVEDRLARLEAWLVDLAAVALAAAVLGGLLWYPSLGWESNAAVVLPSVLDLLLVAGISNALRRSPLHRQGAEIWLAAAFVSLGVADTLVNYLAPRELWGLLAPASAGYAVAMGCFAYAAARPVRPVEVRAALAPSRATVAVLAIGLLAPAALVLPAAARPVLLGLGVVLVWRCWGLIRGQRIAESDPVTGFLAPSDFERHLGGLAQAASPERPVMVVVAELEGFADWVAEHGFSAGDDLVASVAERLEGVAPDHGVWGRLGAARLCWAGMPRGLGGARGLAERIRLGAAGMLPARVGFAMVPDDAATSGNALVAAEEAVVAAASTGRAVVAFNHGTLDGAPGARGYTASVRRRRSEVEAVLGTPGRLHPVFQPIVALEGQAVAGYEALSRMDGQPARGPDAWIAQAHSVGLGVELEAESVRRALVWRGGLPPGAFLALNVGPRLLLSSRLADVLGEDPLDGLVLEITEHARVDDYAQLAARLAGYRTRGARVAIDDAGAGHSSLRHVMQLRPDFVKLDPSLIRGIEGDAARRALVESLVTFNAEIGARLVAEGIETAAELDVLRRLGVELGQGYHLGRPEQGFARAEQPRGRAGS